MLDFEFLSNEYAFEKEKDGNVLYLVGINFVPKNNEQYFSFQDGINFAKENNIPISPLVFEQDIRNKLSEILKDYPTVIQFL